MKNIIVLFCLAFFVYELHLYGQILAKPAIINNFDDIFHLKIKIALKQR